MSTTAAGQYRRFDDVVHARAEPFERQGAASPVDQSIRAATHRVRQQGCCNRCSPSLCGRILCWTGGLVTTVGGFLWAAPTVGEAFNDESSNNTKAGALLLIVGGFAWLTCMARETCRCSRRTIQPNRRQPPPSFDDSSLYDADPENSSLVQPNAPAALPLVDAALHDTHIDLENPPVNQPLPTWATSEPIAIPTRGSLNRD
jgi:hypothetical protein